MRKVYTCAKCGKSILAHREIDAACPIHGGYSLSMRFTRREKDRIEYREATYETVRMG
jgi:ribosomal protein L32